MKNEEGRLTYEPKYLDETKWRDELQALTDEYERMLAFVEQELATAPEGRLVIHPSENGTEYYYVDEHGRRYLPKRNMGIIHALAEKSYYLRLKPVLEKRVVRFHGIMNDATLKNPKEIYSQMSLERKKLVSPLDSSLQDYIRQWAEQVYETKGFLEGEPEYYAKNGMRVRSKSEGTIVDLLFEYEALFRYECKLYLRGLGEIHPDFIVLNKRTGEVFIWEHFGKVDDWKYANDMVKRIEAYHFNGYYEGKNLIYTMESSRYPFGARDAKRIIEQYLI